MRPAVEPPHGQGALKTRLWRWLKISSPSASAAIAPITSGPVWRQAIDEFDGSSNQLPCRSRSMKPRLKEVMWQVTPRTLGSAMASTTMSLPVQSVPISPTGSAAAAAGAARARAATRTPRRATMLHLPILRFSAGTPEPTH